MSDAAKPPVAQDASSAPQARAELKPCPPYAVVCERCGGAQVYRMHAVWRCADCGYKTDCCGW